jgi:hypothetical protein
VVLDVAIGMGFIFLTCSVLCSGIVEAIAGLFRLRARDLENGIRALISGDGKDAPTALRRIESDVLGHSLLAHLSLGGSRKPSYIPSRTFVMALFDALVQDPTKAPGSPPEGSKLEGPGGQAASAAASPAPVSFQEIAQAVAKLPEGDLKDSLALLVRHAGNNVDTLRDHAETWFNNAMERMSGAYKRRAQVLNGIVGFALCAALNLDAIGLVNTISADPGVRSALSSAAMEKAKSPAPGAAPEPVGDSLRNLAGQFSYLREDPSFSRLPLGWSHEMGRWQETAPGSGTSASHRPLWLMLLLKAMGLAFSTFAISLGAPFWFDVLGKVANLRLAGSKPPAPAPAPKGNPGTGSPSPGGGTVRAGQPS